MLTVGCSILLDKVHKFIFVYSPVLGVREKIAVLHSIANFIVLGQQYN